MELMWLLKDHVRPHVAHVCTTELLNKFGWDIPTQRLSSGKRFDGDDKARQEKLSERLQNALIIVRTL